MASADDEMRKDVGYYEHGETRVTFSLTTGNGDLHNVQHCTLRVQSVSQSGARRMQRGVPLHQA